ncbi:hypothetical protein FMM06_14545 [Glacieibacterium frigidum]|uniref:peptidoglycan lytic exotransglycosylase n=2 Tax=Glacieibacterium frigidum TaxID=2593303 RepID=A0A552UAW0_9SPHN|nr:hypothetical protein FMM06_14545 [Glacieibacterium frigidum]
MPDLGDATAALAAFRRSCGVLVKRTDLSGLTEAGDWAGPCAAAATATDAKAFFATLVPVQVGPGTGLNTGYYEPELAGSRTSLAGGTPLYRRPPDLIEVDLGAFGSALTGKKIRGRVAGQGFVPYYDRAAIDAGALNGRGLELAWAADPYEAFFLEIQGSGRLRLPDGTVMRVGYDGQNGRDYTGIGKLLRDRGLLGPGQATMDGIIGWMKRSPDKGVALMHENRSKIFFRELPPGDPALGPPGAIGIALTPQVSVAADPRFVPLGAPLWLSSKGEAPFTRVMVAQDTGGAIKGANRLDVFWGAGADARRIAGGMSATGTAILLLPPASAARLGL